VYSVSMGQLAHKQSHTLQSRPFNMALVSAAKHVAHLS